MKKKTGFFRIISRDGSTEEMAYTELYSSKEYAQTLKERYDRREVQLFCACRSDNTLELTITKNLVIRVADNKRQSEHAVSCPKSVLYAKWLSENSDGVNVSSDEDRLVFNISIPTGRKILNREKNGSSSSTSSETKKKMEIAELASKINAQAWLYQTYSIKKKIREAHINNQKADWEYKSIEDFHKLFFGITKDVLIQYRKNQFPLNDICYKKTTFYEADSDKKFFLYAEIIQASKFDDTRKYQYITLKLPSKNSQNKATIRILTEDIQVKVLEALYHIDNQDVHYILTGYVRHDVFQNEKGISDWITLLKGIIIKVSKNGLYCRNINEAKLYNDLCKRHILFHKPVFPLESYGNQIPTLIIERKGEKDLLVDIAKNQTDYDEKMQIEEREEYEHLIFEKSTESKDILEQIFQKFKKRDQK